MKSSLRVIFAGTPDFAAEQLNHLLNANIDVVAVYTQPDRRAKRGRKLTASPVKLLALQHDLPVQQPVSLKEDADKSQLDAYQADLMIVVAYGLLLPQTVLDMPRLGCINVHASLLPRWRGAAPIERAIEAGDQKTGVCIMQMEAGLDTGPVLARQSVPVSLKDNSDSLFKTLSKTAAPLLIKTLDQIESIEPQVQNDDLATYAKKLNKDELKVDWQQNAVDIALRSRAFYSRTFLYFEHADQRIKLWQLSAEIDSKSPANPGTILEVNKNGVLVKCGIGSIRVHQLQLPGSKALQFADFYNAKPGFFTSGSQLG